ncbi:polysaccharide biosynthesis/export family protein [Lutibaculum baratangense]|uniref:Polysaccharide biosynthesis/export protein n=1 Tax=Lutibaculum baratangense AMV1 TaxID=631454 RepID=V4RCD7_9HYPH|nr:polysaccharide biosynthesis/export family protein [Lutibaculum baratangense]ESR23054.1 polysaccharide biosynthesis/export protein [Lutibaculum baratangense AMV1]
MVCAAAFVAAGTAALADEWSLQPDTQLRVTVSQWLPGDGQYRRLEALSGDFVVGPEGRVSFPVLGSVDAANHTPAELADHMVERLKTSMGLLAPPDVIVEVIGYPPIYVTGDVDRPGSFPYRPTMTILQAVALSGGVPRGKDAEDERDRSQLLSQLRALREDIARTMSRAARLKAELEGDAQITFPPEIADGGAQDGIDAVLEQERIIFAARNKAQERQYEALEELIALFKGEISVLESKISDLDSALAFRSKELEDIRALVEKGLATTSRRSDLERLVSDLRANRLDQQTAIMRARQGISEAERNKVALVDEQRTKAAEQLQEEQARLVDLRLDEKLKLELLAQLGRRMSALGAGPAERPTLTFTIVREDAAGPRELIADETTRLRPGDVVRARLVTAGPSAAASDAGPVGPVSWRQDAAAREDRTPSSVE